MTITSLACVGVPDPLTPLLDPSKPPSEPLLELMAPLGNVGVDLPDDVAEQLFKDHLQVKLSEGPKALWKR